MGSNQVCLDLCRQSVVIVIAVEVYSGNIEGIETKYLMVSSHHFQIDIQT